MFIAEIGINHNGSIEIAKQLIRVAKDAGADVVKFQKRTPEICVPRNEWNKMRSTPWGDMTYIEYKHRVEFDKEGYDEINRYCNKIGIRWTASVWDIPSLEFILQYDIPFIKIASAMITDTNLLMALKESGKPLIMSIGMSTENEIAEALDILNYNNVELLWCNSNYPSIDEEIDLNAMAHIKTRFGLTVGYSGHELDDLPTVMAATMGANIIERHITLNRGEWGTDHKASLEPTELIELITKLKRIKTIQGIYDITCYPSERIIANKLRKKD